MVSVVGEYIEGWYSTGICATTLVARQAYVTLFSLHAVPCTLEILNIIYIFFKKGR